ncbi:hypothetical protein [Haloactinomyces albus]|uniref:Uncharacterized protein n=1 Tax=Haloactinomyces albus TaxID=1352928 RepID=A0AAE3ZH42_9ACTN|nr:hypothetical protein [Haloactinomyces albus]MDR7303503.1 hypothetical protein [Haloactinomyces albus]
MLRIAHHRRFTANHTWHVEWAGHQFFVKANPHHAEARDERAGHERLRAYYPVPKLFGSRRFGRWTVHVYRRWPPLGHDAGLLLDEITRVDRTDDTRRLDVCLSAVFGHYRQVIPRTLCRTTNANTVSKLYGDRAGSEGRLDRYYRPDTPWRITTGARKLRPSDLSALRLLINSREHTLDFADLMAWLRVYFANHNPVWAALTQGDPTDVNIGWSPTTGPVWFDYDTGGLNALAGEFACFLLYQRLHGAWLTPHYNPTVFRDHPSALAASSLAEPILDTEYDNSCLRIVYRHIPSTARRHVMHRYLNEIVHPFAEYLGVDDLMAWLRPYLVMRLLAVYHLADLETRDAALSLALLAEALDPAITLPRFLALTPLENGDHLPCPALSP